MDAEARQNLGSQTCVRSIGTEETSWSFCPCPQKHSWCRNRAGPLCQASSPSFSLVLLSNTGVLCLTCCHRKTPLGTRQELRDLQSWPHIHTNAFPECGSGLRIISRTGNTEAVSGALGLNAVKTGELQVAESEGPAYLVFYVFKGSWQRPAAAGLP